MAKLLSKKKRAAYASGVRVYLHDEAPRIGSGWRVVEVVKNGRQWVRIREVATGRVARLRKQKWQVIAVLAAQRAFYGVSKRANV